MNAQQDHNKQEPANDSSQDTRRDFLEKKEMGLEMTDEDNAGDASFTPIYLTSDSTLQTPEEKRHDEQVDPGKNTTVEASEDDLNETASDRRNAGGEVAGT